MFWIVGAEEIVHALHKISTAGVFGFLATQFTHKTWQGFAFYDLIFPLFVFMVGVSSVFSLTRLIEREGRAAAVRRVIRRAVLLYLFGIFYYGGFSTPFAQIRLLGVLQRIALCYLFAGLIFCFFQTRGRIIACVSLLVVYWALMSFVPVPGGGAGNFDEGKNLANYVDKEYLPLRKWDGDHDPEGLLSTLPAIGTCLLGVFAGTLLRSQRVGEQRKVLYLIAGGAAAVALGWLWNYQFPVIKKIWTSSYVLVAGGYSALLLAAFYEVIEIWRWRAWSLPFVWIGTNAITIYMANEIVNFRDVAQRFVGGEINEYFGRYGQLVIVCVVMLLIFAFCRFLYKRKIFLRL